MVITGSFTLVLGMNVGGFNPMKIPLTPCRQIGSGKHGQVILEPKDPMSRCQDASFADYCTATVVDTVHPQRHLVRIILDFAGRSANDSWKVFTQDFCQVTSL